ncbi:MAG: hypothetical protein AAF733_02325 [Verrucomicrobiota bacterium]
MPLDDDAAEQSVKVRRRTILTIILAVGAIVVGFVVLVIGVAALFWLTASELEVTDEVEAAVVTIRDMEKWFEFEAKPELEEWDSDYFFDRSVNVYYFYDDPDEAIYLNCNLTYEPKVSDAILMYQIEWNGLRLSNQIRPGENIELEESDIFSWGDTSRFAFQRLDGERYGFAFVGRKGGKVFFLDCWGMVLEDEEEIAQFLQPHLDALEAVSFQKKGK